MRIKLDENMPTGLVLTLTSLGHDVDTVPQENLTGQPDSAIWTAAQSEGRVLVTQDLDFSDVRKYKPGTHAGLVLVRLTDPSRLRLASRLLSAFDSGMAADFQKAFVVVTDRKIRIQRLADPND